MLATDKNESYTWSKLNEHMPSPFFFNEGTLNTFITGSTSKTNFNTTYTCDVGHIRPFPNLSLYFRDQENDSI